jgi:hypothetical protein
MFINFSILNTICELIRIVHPSSIPIHIQIRCVLGCSSNLKPHINALSILFKLNLSIYNWSMRLIYLLNVLTAWMEWWCREVWYKGSVLQTNTMSLAYTCRAHFKWNKVSLPFPYQHDCLLYKSLCINCTSS